MEHLQFYIETEFLETDQADLFEMDSDPQVHRYLGNRPVKTIDEIKSWQEMFKDSVNYRYAVDDLKALAKEFPSLQQEEDFKLLEKDVEFRTKDLTL